MNDEDFQPKNDLEQRLLAAQEGRIPGQEFMSFLLTSQVFMPVREEHNIGGFQASTTAKPLSIKDENGIDILILFTSPERSRAFLTNYPDCTGGLLEEFKGLMVQMGVGFGVSLNPGCSVGMDMEPAMVEQLTAQSTEISGHA